MTLNGAMPPVKFKSIVPSLAPTVFPPRPVEAKVPAAVPLVNDAGPFKSISASTKFPEAL